MQCWEFYSEVHVGQFRIFPKDILTIWKAIPNIDTYSMSMCIYYRGHDHVAVQSCLIKLSTAANGVLLTQCFSYSLKQSPCLQRHTGLTDNEPSKEQTVSSNVQLQLLLTMTFFLVPFLLKFIYNSSTLSLTIFD